MEGYILWCSSVIKVGDTYHLFASRWPAEFGLGGWTKYSECVRATSKTLLGPYQFKEVVLEKRPEGWDNSRIHNVKIVKVADKFVLYYINAANETGYAVADKITGPWTRSNAPVIHATNPAILVHPDNTIYVFARLKDSANFYRGIAFTAPNYAGPYSLLKKGDNLLPNGAELADPTIWWANNQYNLLLTDVKGHLTGTFKSGSQYFSKDGVHYEAMSAVPVFSKTVIYDDGTSETYKRRERPFIYTNEKNEVMALFTACMTSDNKTCIVVNPVNHYVPGN
jgi:hypothetical protein